MAEPVDDAKNSGTPIDPAGQSPGSAGPEAAGIPATGAQAPSGEPGGVPAGVPGGEPLPAPADAPAGGEAIQPAEPAAPAESAESVQPAEPAQSAEPVESAGGALATTEDQGRPYDGTEPHQYAGSEGSYDHGQYGQGDSATAEKWQYQQEQEGEEQEGEDEEEDEEEDGQKKMTLVEHLEELRTRIIRAAIGLAVGMGVALAFGEYIFKFINEPIVKVLGKDALITTSMMDPFTRYMTICLYGGLIVSSPWVFYQLWMFISAGLYPNERRYVTRSVPFSAALFIAGALFFVKIVSIPLLQFLKYWNSEVMGLKMMPTLVNHVEFMTDMMVIFGLCFQMPLAILILAKVGLVSLKTLNHYRKHAIVGILVVGAILSPSPSPLDQMALAIPMYLLYELGVLLTYFLVERKRRREEAAEAAEEAAELAAERAAAGSGPDAGEAEEPADAEYEYTDEPEGQADKPSEGTEPPGQPKRTE
jgi:sec-independent protein translocase protein TatC